MPHPDDNGRAAAVTSVPRPGPDEYAPAFAAEIALVPAHDDFGRLLCDQLDATQALARAFGETHAACRYADGKWTVRETIGHLADCERVLSYRLLRALRGDGTALAGFDHVAFVPAGHFEARSLASVVAEFAAVRAATVALVADTPSSQFAFSIPVGSGRISARALAYVIAGHERHHQALLQERYLPVIRS